MSITVKVLCFVYDQNGDIIIIKILPLFYCVYYTLCTHCNAFIAIINIIMIIIYGLRMTLF